MTGVYTTGILGAADLTIAGGNTVLSIIQLLLGLAVLGAGIYTAVDANKYSDQAHQAAGMQKMLWVIGGPLLGVIGCACCFPLGLIAPIAWFAVYKKKVEAAQSGGGFGFGAPPPPPGGFGGPPPPGGFGGPPPPPQGGGFPPPPPQ